MAKVESADQIRSDIRSATADLKERIAEGLGPIKRSLFSRILVPQAPTFAEVLVSFRKSRIKALSRATGTPVAELEKEFPIQ